VGIYGCWVDCCDLGVVRQGDFVLGMRGEWIVGNRKEGDLSV
jgi:hypothetical protein